MTNSKTKVTLPLYLLEHYVMKAYGRVEVYSIHSNPLDYTAVIGQLQHSVALITAKEFQLSIG